MKDTRRPLREHVLDIADTSVAGKLQGWTPGLPFFAQCTISEVMHIPVLHYVDCVSMAPALGSISIMNAHPQCTVYDTRKSESRRTGHTYMNRPGTCQIDGKGGSTPETRYVVSLFGQIMNGPSEGSFDGATQRIDFFHDGLEHMYAQEKIRSIAIPHGVGCNDFGGDKYTYYREIKRFAADHPDFAVIICLFSPAHLGKDETRIEVGRIAENPRSVIDSYTPDIQQIMKKCMKMMESQTRQTNARNDSGEEKNSARSGPKRSPPLGRAPKPSSWLTRSRRSLPSSSSSIQVQIGRGKPRSIRRDGYDRRRDDETTRRRPVGRGRTVRSR
jgi:hypothetical protein